MSASVGAVAAQLCTAPTFFNGTVNIINVPMGHLYNLEGVNASLPTYWFSTAPNITAIPPTAVEDDPDGWIAKPLSELAASLPLSNKPLLIDCPMPACAFPISGTYSDLQRYLMYTNLVVAVVATAVPLLRGIAQLFLATTAMSSLFHLVIIYGLRDRQLVDMDFLPAAMYSSTGIVSTLVWCLFRSQRFTRTLGQFMIFQFLPICPCLLACLGTFFGFLEGYKIGNQPSAVLLESETAYRLTSPCYGDKGGGAALWLGPFNYLTRQQGELQFILPPEGSDITTPEVQPIQLSSMSTGVLAILITYLVLFVGMGFMAICGIRSTGRPWIISMSFLSHFPKWFQQL